MFAPPVALLDNIFEFRDLRFEIEPVVSALVAVTDLFQQWCEVSQGVDPGAVGVFEPGTILAAAAEKDGCLGRFYRYSLVEPILNEISILG